uniref:Putative ovule protein n=1 Tax=Solanum chacoense TaxID=4108 RepID=A0A0V0H254_SOLCH
MEEKSLQTTPCKFYHCQDESTFKRDFKQDKIIEGVFLSTNQKKKKNKKRKINIKKLCKFKNHQKNSAPTFKIEIEESNFLKL